MATRTRDRYADGQLHLRRGLQPRGHDDRRDWHDELHLPPSHAAAGAGRRAGCRRSTALFANDTVSYSYDELGRGSRHGGFRLSSTTSAYDSLGRLTSLASPVGTFTGPT